MDTKIVPNEVGRNSNSGLNIYWYKIGTLYTFGKERNAYQLFIEIRLSAGSVNPISIEVPFSYFPDVSLADTKSLQFFFIPSGQMGVDGEGIPLNVELKIENNNLTVTLPEDMNRLLDLTGVYFGIVTVSCLCVDD